MSVDAIVAGLPAMRFGDAAPISWSSFLEKCGGEADWVVCGLGEGAWADLETQLRNAMAESRGGDAKYRRAADGCSLYWRDRVRACFQEADVLRRDELLDRVWWDAAAELVPPAAPLGRGALLAYAVRLKVALKRSAISQERGGAAFDRMAAETATQQLNNSPTH